MPRRTPRSSSTLLLTALLALSGCNFGAGPTSPGTPKPTTRPGASRSAEPVTGPALVPPGAPPGAKPVVTRIVGAGGQALQLTGVVRILSDNGAGILSDNGAGIISNNTGGILSDNGAGLIGNNSGGLVANNGGGLTSKAKYALRQTGGPAEFRLAEARLTIHDAQGRMLVGADGQPLGATSDGQGGFTLAADLPAEGLVLRIALWNGGTLEAMLPRDTATGTRLDVDTSSSLGAAYVLGQFVKGDQGTFDKLPADEARRLTEQLQAAQALVKAAPKYDAGSLVALADDLRKQAPAVDRSFEDIRALLIGQANLGAGRPATQVALIAPEGLAVDGAGRVLVGESRYGRIRAIGTDGLMTTYADANRGQVRRAFPNLTQIAPAPGGGMYVVTQDDGRVWKIAADGAVTPFAGTGTFTRVAPGGLAAEASMNVGCVAVGPDGTVYVGEHGGDEAKGEKPRILAVGPDGRTRLVHEGTLAGGGISALTATAQGLYYIEQRGPDARYVDIEGFVKFDGSGYREVSTGLVPKGLTAGPDGTVYVSDGWGGRVVAIAPDGKQTDLLGGKSGVALGAGAFPSDLALGLDGTLYVLAANDGRVLSWKPGGAVKAIAGALELPSFDGGLTDLPLNGPTSVAFAPDGSMIVSEDGSDLIRRFDGKAITTIAGGMSFVQAARDFAQPGEGIKALGACLGEPRGLAYQGDTLLVMEQGSRRIRAITPDGLIRTRVGKHGIAVYEDEGAGVGSGLLPSPDRVFTVKPDVPAQPQTLRLRGNTVVVGPDGLAYFTTGVGHQVLRQRADGLVEVVAGAQRAGVNAVAEDAVAALVPLTDGMPAAEAQLSGPNGLAFGPDGALYVAEALGMRLLRIDGVTTPTPTIKRVAGIQLAELLALPVETPVEAEGRLGPDAGVIAPTSLVVDPQGRLIWAEMGTTTVTTLDARLAGEFQLPEGIRPSFPRVRRMGKDGRVTTIAGPGGRFFKDPNAEDALVLPSAVAIDPQGRLVIVDTGANLVRILPAGSY